MKSEEKEIRDNEIKRLLDEGRDILTGAALAVKGDNKSAFVSIFFCPSSAPLEAAIEHFSQMAQIQYPDHTINEIQVQLFDPTRKGTESWLG
jgi:hypothetical protein